MPPEPRPLVERFWEKVQRTDNGCWTWTGATVKSRGGLYGKIKHEGRLLRAHRVSLALATGEMQEDMEACHRCHNTLCVNPSHLYWGTHDENLANDERRGRDERGRFAWAGARG